MAPFEQLNREFEFHYLFYRSQDEEEGSHTSQPRHYWNDFAGADEILDAIRPDRVVYMSLLGLRPIALNMAARRRGVRTFIFQHGYFHSLEDYLSLPTAHSTQTDSRESRVASAWRAVRFMLRGNLAKQPVDSLLAIAMLLTSRGTDQYRSQLRFRFRGRIPDRYITYTEATSEFHVQLDGASLASITPIGIPEYDPIFQLLTRSERQGRKGVLLIDSPNAENRYGVTTTTIEIKARFLESLSRRLQQRGHLLTVKLHPETYQATWLPSHPNTKYVRDQDVGELIDETLVCLGFDSTMMIPAIIQRPTMLFELRASKLFVAARELGVATVIGGLECSDEQLDSLLAAKQPPAERIEAFVQRFAYATDGLATRRLAGALRDVVS